ncbi:hypothetical protein [Thermosulfurimonas marina]|nr:hypothetical protein [Thermosulfurimonas marina]
MEIKVRCACGAQEASFNLRDHVLPPEVVESLYCPACAEKASFDPARMLRDRDWIIVYDMELARFMMRAKLGIDPQAVTPEFLFDEGYATWKETYPGELEEIEAEKARIVALLKEDPQRYFEELRQWAQARVERLKALGWRKAQRM